MKYDNAVIMVATQCFLSHFVSGDDEGVSLSCFGQDTARKYFPGIGMGRGYDELGGASGAEGGDTGLVAAIGVSFLSWGIGSPPMKS